MIEKIIIAILACALTFFLIRGCDKGKAVQSLQDSLTVEREINDTVMSQARAWKLKHDSITAAKQKGDSLYTRKIDSLNTVCSSLKTKFLSTRDTIANLHDRLNKAFSDNDTTGVWDIADSLNKALVVANNQLFNWQISRDSISSAQLAEIQRLEGIITQLQAEIAQFQGLLKMCTDNNAALSKTTQAAIKKLKVRGLLSKIGAGIVAVLTVALIAK